MTRVLFVCHGNICRSPMAEFVMAHLVKERGRNDISIASAGTSAEELGNDMHYGSKEQLKKHGVPFTKRSARQVRRDDYDRFDYFVAMDSANVSNLERIFGGDPKRKIHKLLSFSGSSDDVADPWYTGNFERTYSDVLKGCAALLEKL